MAIDPNSEYVHSTNLIFLQEMNKAIEKAKEEALCMEKSNPNRRERK